MAATYLDLFACVRFQGTAHPDPSWMSYMRYKPARCSPLHGHPRAKVELRGLGSICAVFCSRRTSAETPDKWHPTLPLSAWIRPQPSGRAFAACARAHAAGSAMCPLSWHGTVLMTRATPPVALRRASRSSCGKSPDYAQGSPRATPWTSRSFVPGFSGSTAGIGSGHHSET